MNTKPLKSRIYRLGSLLVIFLYGCSTNSSGPVNIREVTDSPVVEVNRSTEANSAVVEVNTVDLQPLIVQPEEPPAIEAASASSPVKSKIFQQAQSVLQEKNYQKAIELAEQGLRIDRRDPEFYAILAEAYAKLSDPDQAAQFAQQGLRYATKGSEVYRALQQWL